MGANEPIALAWNVVLAVLRLTTQQRLLQRPLRPQQALEPGPQHWTLCSADNGFGRFNGLRFRNPLR